MERDKLDFGTMKIGPLFRAMFFPTLIGMIFNSVITLIDGIFVGRGVGGNGIAAVNIVVPPWMIATGIGLMFGIGASVIGSIRLSEGNIKAARIIMTQAFIASSMFVLLLTLWLALFPDLSLEILGCSDDLKGLALSYMLPILPAIIFTMVSCVGMMLIRLDGSPKYAMWCQAVPATINIVLDYIMIFPMGMGIRGAAWATMISCALGASMVLVYFIWIADKLKFFRIKTSRKSLMLSLRNVGYMMKIGFATFLTEIAMSVMIVTGNYMFMSRLGSQGVAAYAIACYLFPVVFSIANAVAQSAQPIISFNYGSDNKTRVNRALKIALSTAVLCGLIVTVGLWIGNRAVVSAFLSTEEPAYAIAFKGLPYFATCAVFFAVNITFIGYYQSIERAWQSIFYTLLRGIILIIPAFIVMPIVLGDNGLWFAIPAAELLTLIVIVTHFFVTKKTLNTKVAGAD